MRNPGEKVKIARTAPNSAQEKDFRGLRRRRLNLGPNGEAKRNPSGGLPFVRGGDTRKKWYIAKGRDWGGDKAEEEGENLTTGKREELAFKTYPVRMAWYTSEETPDATTRKVSVCRDEGKSL